MGAAELKALVMSKGLETGNRADNVEAMLAYEALGALRDDDIPLHLRLQLVRGTGAMEIPRIAGGRARGPDEQYQHHCSLEPSDLFGLFRRGPRPQRLGVLRTLCQT